MSCGNCNTDSSHEEKKEEYQCKNCGSKSEQGDDCCGEERGKVCSCGSGKYSKECCETEAN